MTTSTRILAGGAALLAAAGLLGWQQGCSAGDLNQRSPSLESSTQKAASTGQAPTLGAGVATPSMDAGKEGALSAIPLRVTLNGDDDDGQRILALHETGSAQDAWRALKLLLSCERIQRDGIVPAQSGLPAGWRELGVAQEQALARRCKSFTPAIAALKLPLALRAMRGGIKGAAAIYFRSSRSSENDAVVPVELELMLKRDAQQGDLTTLEALNSYRVRFGGVSDVERRAYRLALETLYPIPSFARTVIRLETVIGPAENFGLGEEEEARAKALADEIIAAGRRAAQPPRP